MVDNTYYFVTGHAGDILAIFDDGGRIVVEYEYDAWGHTLYSIFCNDSIARANQRGYRLR